MNFIASEIHKAYSPFFNDFYNEQCKSVYSIILNKHYSQIDEQLKGQNYLTGSNFTIADIYLFVVTRWADFIGLDLKHFMHLASFMQRIAECQTVQDAIAAESPCYARKL